MTEKNNKDISLYFIAIVPPQEVANEVMSFKHNIKEHYNSKAALRSPPHITLYMPFKWKEHKEEIIITSLEELGKERSSFEVRLKDFGCFEPRVIYVDVVKNEPLAELHKSVIMMVKRKLKLFDKGFERRPFNPHMTIGFRDLKKPLFYKAWEEYKSKSFEASFIAKEISLLKHDGKQWQRHVNFLLKG